MLVSPIITIWCLWLRIFLSWEAVGTSECGHWRPKLEARREIWRKKTEDRWWAGNSLMGRTVPGRSEPTDSSTQPRRRRWSCVCLWRLTWSRIGYVRMSHSSRRPSIRTPSTLIRERSTDLDPLHGAKPKWYRHRVSWPLIPEPRRQLPGAGAQPVGSGGGRCKLDTSDPTYPELIQHRTSTGIWQPKPTPHHFTLGSPTPAFRIPDRPFPRVGTQLEFDCFKDGVPNMTGPDLRDGLLGMSDGSDLSQAPAAVLMDSVAHLQLEVAAMKAGTPDHQMIGGPTSPVRHKPVVFTSTKVPRFAGVTSCDQYRQVFDAIAQSNGWMTRRPLYSYYLTWRVIR